MYTINHVSAAGLTLRDAALYLQQRLGFTISRGDSPTELRAVFEDGYLELRQEGYAWEWSRFTLRSPDPDPAAAIFAQTLSAVLPEVISPPVPLRPQDAMEPDRARAVVQHANTAIGLAGVMVIVKDLNAAVPIYEEALGAKAGEPFEDNILGITARDIPLSGGQRITVATASLGTGAAAHFAGEKPAGIFAPIIRVRSLKAAADALRQGATYSYYTEDRLVTSEGLPGLGALIFEEGQ